MDPTNSIAWTRKSYIESVVSCRVGFQPNLGQKLVLDPRCELSAQFSVATNSHADSTKGNQPLLFFHMDPTNSIAWARKSFY
jgi:hypothetical protein